MKSEINILQSIVTPLTELLSGAKVKVRFSGANAQTLFNQSTGKPTEIILPLIPGSANKDVISSYHGYLDHEVGHVLFTKLTPVSIKSFDPRVVQTFFNIIEDARIERLMCKSFRGSAHNLEKLYEKVFDKANQASIECSDFTKGETVIDASVYAVRALMGQRYFADAVAEHPTLNAFTTLIGEHFRSDLNAVVTTDDAIRVAKKMVDFFGIKETTEMKEGAPSDVATETSEEGTSGEAKSGEDAANKDQKGTKSKTVSKKTKGKKSESAGKGEEGKSDSKPKEGASSGDSEKSESSKTDGKDKDHPYGKLDKDTDRDAFEEAVGHALKKQAEDVQRHASYRVKTVEFDEVKHGKMGRIETVRKIETQVNSMTGAIQKNLERAIAADSIAIWTSGHRKGKLYNPALARLLMGDDRVFRKKQVGRSKDVAVSLVVDCSGSMYWDSKIRNAVIAAYAFCSVLTNMGIACEVIGFTTLNVERDYAYSRIGAIYMPIFKSFTDQWDMSAKRRTIYPCENKQMLKNNVDGECVQIAANRLLARPEAGKIMIVLSDGQPAADGVDLDLESHLQSTLEDLEKRIKIIGIGIQSNSVADYYKNYVVLDQVEDLPKTVIQKVKSLLLS